MHCGNCGNQLAPNLKFCPKCGTPVAQPSAYTPPSYVPPVAPQAQTAWGANSQAAAPRKKSRLGKILLILLAVFVLGIAGVGVAAYYGYRYIESSLKSSDAYKMADAELKRSSAVAESMGEIRSTGFPIGTYKEDADGSGSAAFTMSVEGAKASGQYFVTMERKDSAWRIAHAVVKLPDGKVVNVVEEQRGGNSSPVGDGNWPPNIPHIGPPPPPLPPGVRPSVSGGVLNGKAISKPAPAYPPIAKAAHAAGMVVVQVTVDESGNVTEAKAVSGHPLLQQAAVAAARQARFTPTLLSGKPVKVSGVITYEFKPE
ncbi:MAG: TonB family protein [Acidobacteria bacterium]|nr:TonB family protein [Acidobacteriota bacterium]